MDKKIILILILFAVSVLTIGFSLFNKDALKENKPQEFEELKKKVITEDKENQEMQPKQELKIEDTKVGEGKEVKIGDTIVVHYVGTLENGAKFDSSRDRGEPTEFKLEEGGLIQGWIEGIPGMKVGGIRKLTIPPELGYGSQDLGTIPANSTLIFEVELMEIKENTVTATPTPTP